jgi:hypothetical protein
VEEGKMKIAEEGETKSRERKNKLRKEARNLNTFYLALFLPIQISLQDFN